MADGGSRLGWSAGFEWILYLAALALAMAQDAVDDARISNDGDNLHFSAAAHNTGLTSRIFLGNRAHVLRASLAKPESSPAGWAWAVGSEKSCTLLPDTLARLL